jgi:hypothetical protein
MAAQEGSGFNKRGGEEEKRGRGEQEATVNRRNNGYA